MEKIKQVVFSDKAAIAICSFIVGTLVEGILLYLQGYVVL